MNLLGKYPLLSSVIATIGLAAAYAASSHMDNAAADFAESYQRGLDAALTSVEPESRTAPAQLREICAQPWPDTLDGGQARRIACGPRKSAGSPL